MTTQEIITEELETLRAEIIEASTKAGQKASGRTYEGIQAVDVTDRGGKLVGPSYVRVLATGRRAGKVPYDFPEIIKEWAAYKGISFATERDFDRWARAVAWKIRKDGTSLWRDMGSQGLEADIFYTPIRNFIKRITRRLGEATTAEIIKSIQ